MVYSLPRRRWEGAWWDWSPPGDLPRTVSVPTSPLGLPSQSPPEGGPKASTTAHAQGNWSSQCLHLRLVKIFFSFTITWACISKKLINLNKIAVLFSKTEHTVKLWYLELWYLEYNGYCEVICKSQPHIF